MGKSPTHIKTDDDVKIKIDEIKSLVK